MNNVVAPKGKPDLALQYIREKKYCSYSSLKHVRDCTNPYEKYSGDQRWGDIGTETHSRWLEGIEGAAPLYGDLENTMVRGMVRSLGKDKMAMALHRSATGFEVLIERKLEGVPFLGYIDLLRKGHYAADLKTFGHQDENKFIADQDFLQAACYMKAANLYDFYYIGVSKLPLTFKADSLHKVVTRSVLQFPKRIFESKNELIKLLKHVKKECF